MSYLINNFNGGEIGRQLRYRADLQKYPSSCFVLENFLPTPWGGVENRAGFLYLATITECSSDADPGIRLIPFEYSLEASYLIVATDKLFTIYSNGIEVATVATDYAAGTLGKLNFTQSNDVLFIAHPDYAPAMLCRIGKNEFVLEKITLKGGPFMDEDDSGTTLTLSRIDGGADSAYIVTADRDIFFENHVGTLIRFANDVQQNTINKTFDPDTFKDAEVWASESLSHRGSWSVTTYGSWIGTLIVERSFDNGGTWEVFRTYSVNADRNISDVGFEEDKALYRLNFSGWEDPPEDTIYECRASFQSENYETYGILEITEYLTAAKVRVDVLESCASETSAAWSFSAWNDHNGYPKLVTLTSFDRLAFACTAQEPNRLWLSKVGDYNNFYADTEADSSVVTSVKVGTGNGNVTGNAITFIANRKNGLIIGTRSEIGTLSARKNDSPFGPDNILYTPETNPGAADFPPVMVHDCLLFIRRGGESLLELSYNYSTDGFVAPDMTITHPGIFADGGGVREFVFMELPFPVFYFLRHDGELAVFTYNRAENVTAWSRQKTGGKILAIANLPSLDGYDFLYCAVRRGDTVYLEMLSRRDDSTDTSGVWLDNASEVFGKKGFSGITRFAGCTVCAKIDGEETELVFDANGDASFGCTAGHAVCGIKYTSTLTPTLMEIADRLNSSFGEKKRIPKITAKFHRTLGGICQVGSSRSIPVIFRKMSDMDNIMTLKDGTFEINMPDLWDHEKSITVTQDIPWPMTIQAIIMDNE